MLVLICGPSGAGKSSLIVELQRRNQWGVVPTLTTRSTRSGELEKQQIDVSTYQSLYAAGKFFTSNNIHSKLYATLKSDIVLAQQAEKPWLLDFPYSAISSYFSARRPLVIAVIPISEEQLVRQLTESGRESRTIEALADLRSLCAELASSSLPENVYAVDNEYASLNRTADAVELIIRLQLNGANEA